MIGHKYLVCSVSMEMISATVTQKPPRSCVVFQDPKDGANIRDTIKRVVLPIRTGISHNRQAVLAISHHGGCAILGGVICATRTIRPTRTRCRRMVGVQPKIEIIGIDGGRVYR